MEDGFSLGTGAIAAGWGGGWLSGLLSVAVGAGASLTTLSAGAGAGAAIFGVGSWTTGSREAMAIQTEIARSAIPAAPPALHSMRRKRAPSPARRLPRFSASFANVRLPSGGLEDRGGSTGSKFQDVPGAPPRDPRAGGSPMSAGELSA